MYEATQIIKSTCKVNWCEVKHDYGNLKKSNNVIYSSVFYRLQLDPSAGIS